MQNSLTIVDNKDGTISFFMNEGLIGKATQGQPHTLAPIMVQIHKLGAFSGALAAVDDYEGELCTGCRSKIAERYVEGI